MAEYTTATMFDPTQEANIKRRRRMAEILQQQGAPKQTEIVSGYAVPQSGMEQLARALSGGIGAYQNARADTQEQELAKSRQALMAQAIQQMGNDPKAAAGLLMQDPSMTKEGLSLYGDALKNDRAAMELQNQYAREDMKFQREADLKRELQRMRSGATETVDPDTGDIVYTPAPTAKPLPVGALKLQDDALENIGAADYVVGESKRLGKLLSEGAIELGPVTNTTSRIRNYLGASSPTSRAYGDLNTTLEKLRNESLRLNKGVQTEGDAIRAMNEVVASRNDPKLLAENIAKLQNINERAVTLQKNRVNSVRQNYGAAPYDFSQATTVSGAPVPPSVPTPGADPLAAARDAIAKGAPREAVIQRLQQNGIDATGL